MKMLKFRFNTCHAKFEYLVVALIWFLIPGLVASTANGEEPGRQPTAAELIEGKQRVEAVERGEGPPVRFIRDAQDWDLLLESIRQFALNSKAIQLKYDSESRSNPFGQFLEQGELLMTRSPGLPDELVPRYGLKWLRTLPRDTIMGRSEVGVFVHRKNEIDWLTHDELRRIFTNRIKNWSEVRGPNVEIERLGMIGTSAAWELTRRTLLGDEQHGFHMGGQTGFIVRNISEKPASIAIIDLANPPDKLKLIKRLRILPRGYQRPEDVPTDLADSNPLEDALHLLVSPKASSPAREFAEFLSSDRSEKFRKSRGLIPAEKSTPGALPARLNSGTAHLQRGKSVEIFTGKGARPNFVGEGSDALPAELFSENGVQVRYQNRQILQPGPEVYCCASSPDGRYSAVSGVDRTIQVSETYGSHLPGVLKWHISDVVSIEISDDGKRLVSGSEDGVICVWNVLERKMLREFRGHTAPVSCVRFVRGGQELLSVSLDKQIICWDVASGKTKFRFEGDDRWTRLGISPDGQQFICGGWNGTLQTRDLKRGELLRTFRGHTGALHSVAFLPERPAVVSGSVDGSIRVWSQNDGKELSRWDTLGKVAARLHPTPDGQSLLIGQLNGTLVLWNISRERITDQFIGHMDAIVDLDLKSQGQVMTICREGTSRFWQIPPAGQRTRREDRSPTSK